jgi:hypothetical protein
MATISGNGTDGVGVSSLLASRREGAHDLGNGLKAIYQVEAAVARTRRDCGVPLLVAM